MITAEMKNDSIWRETGNDRGGVREHRDQLSFPQRIPAFHCDLIVLIEAEMRKIDKSKEFQL